MRRIMILVGAVALLTMAFSAAAYAKDFQCTTKPCYGTNQSRGDTIYERGGNVSDVIYAKNYDDTVYANIFGYDYDQVFGQYGDDDLWVNDGDTRDRAVGGPGLDVCYGDWYSASDHDALQCEVKVWTYYP